jgi:heme/copper-type cytochrome/quinol oxidase subunit 3
LSAATGLAFLAVKWFEYHGKIDAGLHPSTNLLLACWLTLTAVHALHVAAGVGVNAWLATRQRAMFPAQAAERLRAARLSAPSASTPPACSPAARARAHSRSRWSRPS